MNIISRQMNKNTYTRPAFHKAILICIVLAVYFPVLGNDFLYYWDDQWQVMNRYTEGGLHFNNLWAILTEFYGGQYAPANESCIC